MGLFTKTQKATAQSIYEREVKPFLKQRDGYTHVIMINSFGKWLNQNFGCENKYTTQIDEILVDMQKDGYEIVDIKLTALQNQGLTGQMEGFNTLILYK